MLVKRSRKNQVAIPKAIIERAGLGAEDVYFRVEYDRGAIVLRPVDIEDKIPSDALARFKAAALKGKKGDRSFRSVDALVRDLKKRR